MPSANKKEAQRALIIFLKYPRIGRVKSRLAKEIGMRKALEIYRWFVWAILTKVREIDNTKHFIFYTPKGKKEPLRKIYTERFVYYLQHGKDLGKRMFNAFSKVEKLGYRQTVIIGTDSPTLPSRLIRRAFAKLRNSDVVIGPCLDGGYYLLGLRKSFKELFEDINWSSNQVFAQSLKKARQLKLKTCILPQWYDIDTIQDLKKSGYFRFIKNAKKFHT